MSAPDPLARFKALLEAALLAEYHRGWSSDGLGDLRELAQRCDAARAALLAEAERLVVDERWRVAEALETLAERDRAHGHGASGGHCPEGDSFDVAVRAEVAKCQMCAISRRLFQVAADVRANDLPRPLRPAAEGRSE